MQLGFKAKLMTIMGIFSILLTLSVSSVNQHRLKNSLIESYKRESILVEDTIVTAVAAADKAFRISEKELEKDMRAYSNTLLQKYSAIPDVASWNYQALKKELGGMDVYIIDESLTIIHSSFTKDIGLNFKADGDAPDSFSQLLEERIKGSSFVSDGLDQETNSGKIKKYSYMPTPDHKYLIELGVYLEDTPMFQSIDFMGILNGLIEKYKYINDITIYTTTGKSIGKTGEDGKSIVIANENRRFFDKAFHDSEIQEVHGQGNGYPIFYRYVPYTIQFDINYVRFTDQRMIEIVYNQQELQQNLKLNKQIFSLQLAATILIALIISYIITRLVARPMYLASHDVLTGLSNRATFENALIAIMEKNKRKQKLTALLHIDLDHFKVVNDSLGHDAGDLFLKEVGKRIRAAVHDPNDITARLGGDEFVVILSNIADTQAALQIAEHIIATLKLPIEIQGIDVVNDFSTTASIGIAVAPEHAQDSDALYTCADQALYYAKRSGKNTFSLYQESMAPETDF
ncbi:GGDEF domain-containing protein [Paenibacillus sp. FSL H8-0548]|uniref:GGDEF domain-containing protein n=1 Tax=Paenibacillus sp. FSL H8-0548 TaxID=1920422 RepID=UPI00096DFD84|nr:GGDEF domain-containing protein [Paenibacillus sp. FSL H8-0548]OMF36884.1 GGDEF domain-containing protein [Paenibacillus sp. FSL H8-0548]